ncbi:MAG: thioredoxin domain-containing protein [Desulfovibrionales bacterium]|nr:thioredoxin domain-containing protein [Desulfovibrionales bacterium]
MVQRFLLAAFALLFLSPISSFAADNNELKAQIEAVLKENPEILINILRDNSETVLTALREGNSKAKLAAMKAQWKADVSVPKKVALEGRAVLGNPDAPVTIIAFSDFTCPYCERAAFTINSLLSHYGKTVKFIFKNYPLGSHESARLASQYFVAASQMDQEKAWKLYNEFFANREQLIAEGEAFMKAAAKKVGFDVAKLSATATTEPVNASIDEDIADAEALELEGTPYYLVNNIKIRGALPLNLYSEAVEIALDYENKK